MVTIFKYFSFFTIFLLSSCGGIQMLGGKTSYYSKEFLEQINYIKLIHKEGKSGEALAKLQAINDVNLNPTEKAFKNNLCGVFQFGQKKYGDSIVSFENALDSSTQDLALTSQIHLNLASSYYRLDMKEKSYEVLTHANANYLDRHEFKKFHLLKANLAEFLGQKIDYAESLMLYLSDKENLASLRSDIYFSKLSQIFFELDRSQKIKLLETHERASYFIVGYLGFIESERSYYQTDKEESRSLIKWLERRFSKYEELMTLVLNFKNRIENTSKVDPLAIGIIFPLATNKKVFAERALMGIELALKKTMLIRKIPYVLYVKNNQGTAIAGTHAVEELVEKNHVSIIIGGLFSSEATEEYLRAKKHGVFFISLSEIYLPKEEKDSLLLEIPGSIESQIEHLFSHQMLNHFGKKAAILYPKGQKGESYVEEFWRRAKLSDVEITHAVSFDDTKNDFIDPIKNILHLKFPRWRKEELEVLSELHALEKSRSNRRLQTLGPEIDFDWIFIASYPKETLQIIPYFNYLDAFNLNIIGGPSWRTDSLAKQSTKLGKMYFVGDDVLEKINEFNQSFFEEYGRPMKVIEMRAFDALGIADTIIGDKSFFSRDQIENRVRQMGKFHGLTGQWTLKDNVWIKSMTSMQINRGKITNLFNDKTF